MKEDTLEAEQQEPERKEAIQQHNDYCKPKCDYVHT